MKKVVTVLLLSLIVGALVFAQGASEASSAKPVNLVLSDINGENTIWGKTNKMFADLVKERSGGRINVALFLGGQLGSEEDNVNALRTGVVSITVLNCANFQTRGINVPEYTLFGLPYLIRSSAHGTKFWQGKDGMALSAKVAEATNGEIVSMNAYVSSTPKHFFSKAKREHLADFAGLKMRSATSQISIDMIEAFGMVASPMGLNDVYSALQTGMIDGTEHNLSNIWNYAFYEICPYIILTHQTFNQNGYIMSGIAYNSLSEADRKLVFECMQEACAWCNSEYTNEDVQMRARLEEKGVTIYEPADIQEWYDAAQVLYDKYAKGYDKFIETVISYDK